MKIKEIREKTDKEIGRLLAEKREHLRDVRFKAVSKQYKNYKELGETKRDIARLLTVKKERQLMEK